MLTITKIGQPKMKNTSKGQAEGNYIMVKEMEYAGQFLSFFTNEKTKTWQIGQDISGDIADIKKTPKQDGTGYWYNISFPRAPRGANMPVDALKQELMALSHSIDNKLAPITKLLQEIKNHLSGKDPFGSTSDGRGQPHFGTTAQIQHQINQEIDEFDQDGFNQAMDKN